MKIILSLVCILCLFSCSSSLNKGRNQQLWLNESYRKTNLPSDQYYVQFSEKKFNDFSSKSEIDRKSEFRSELESQLVKGIVEKISVSMISSELQTENKSIDFISSVLQQSTQSASAVLVGKKESFYIDKRKKTISAIVYVKKTDLALGYKSSLNAKIDILKNQIDTYQNQTIKSSISLLGSLNSEINTIKDQMEIYTIISSYPDSSLNKKYSELIIDLTRLNSQYGDLKLKINSLIKEADEMFQNKNNFESILSKLNEALLYDPSSVLVISKKNDYLSKWIFKLTTELNASIINKDFKTSLEISEKLILIDRNNESVYKQNQNNLINSYFKESINKIKSLLRNGSVKESFKILNDITKYSYVNYDEFKAVKLELESSIIDDAIRTINNKIYELKPDEALTICTEILNEYPDNKSLKDLQNKILDNISANEKKGLLETRSTHYVVELNYSFSKFPETFLFNSTSAQPSAKDIFNIDLNNAISNYQFGLYRKINIKDRLSNSSKKHKFSYSQIGLRAGYLNTSTYNFQRVSSTGNSNYLFKPSKLIQLEASYIWRRFFMFNLGFVAETLPKVQPNLSIVAEKNNYFTSTIGIRIPFNFIHLTTDLTGYSNGSDFIKFYPKVGISMNFGFSKKFNNEDQKYIKNKVLKLKDN